MPPQVTFVKLGSNTDIPIKIFVKKSGTSTTKKKTVAINSKSLITLNNQPFHVQLSKDYLNALVAKLKLKILPILFDNDSLETQEFTLDDGKIKVVVPQLTILQVRWAFRVLDFEHPLFKKVWHPDHSMHMLRVEKKGPDDDNKVDFKYKQERVIGGLKDAVKVFVY
ncbi:hypothetical protein Cantr_05454 [Candida viswanathii]|uniref:Uncharacterized protein n=1 Tax=Candida viswanathii TaxID=5486 RepID=A0A367XR02_9ASCO|nr:hypothetical protein Cantr_05454 [Candida viswanathii]